MLIYSQFFDEVWPKENSDKQRPTATANSQKSNEPKPWESHLIDDLNISTKLKAVLDEADQQDDLPLNSVSELMNIFESLEEKNLFLIQQGQENEQLIEEKRQGLIQTKHVLQQEFNNLEKRELEMQARTEKTKMEFANIKAETLDEGSKTIS